MPAPPDNAARASWSAGRWLLFNVLVGPAYFLLGKFGLKFATVGNHVSPVWPPSGLSVGLMLIFGPRLLPGIYAGSFLANVTIPT
jgi:integral membrane sensor domain MASE1